MNDESQWLSEIANGSDQTFKVLYESYSAKVYNTITSYTQDAEELLQDVFATIYNTANKFSISRFSDILSCFLSF